MSIAGGQRYPLQVFRLGCCNLAAFCAGCDPFGMHAALSFEPMDENCFPSASSRGSRADAELLPLSR